MQGRTVILVSHHVQLTAPGVDYVVSLENGRVKFEGSSQAFLESGGYKGADDDEEPVEVKKPVVAAKPKPAVKALADLKTESLANSEASSASEAESDSEEEEEVEDLVKKEEEKKVVRKLIEDETKAVGAVKWDVWSLYGGLMGAGFFWIIFVFSFGGAKLADVAQTWWLNRWASSCELRCARGLPSTRAHSPSLSFLRRRLGTRQQQPLDDLLPRDLRHPLTRRRLCRYAAVVCAVYGSTPRQVSFLGAAPVLRSAYSC